MRDVTGHFEFGRNWAEFSRLIDDARVAQAVEGLDRLAGAGAIAGKTFLDIGCGSGVHSLAALELGASRVVAVDIDPYSVMTSRQVLSRFPGRAPWEVHHESVFALSPEQFGVFDVVYAWGSLHHTGSLRKAWQIAAKLVAPGGLLIVAVYRKTRLGHLWKLEKWLYSRSSAYVQACVRASYVGGIRLFFLLTGKNFTEYRDNHQLERGMDFYRDVHDWLGGYPYEEMSPREADDLRRSIGFVAVREFVESGTSLGLLSSGNDQYVWKPATAFSSDARAGGCDRSQAPRLTHFARSSIGQSSHPGHYAVD
jgi:2-polyprenyl-6-hydroxyphenyl methylase/3-demethylubiquinone-9 3-methyltransferase